MESSSSSSSSKHLTEDCLIEKQKFMATQLVSNCLTVLPLSIPQFIHNPFGPSALPKQPVCSSNNPNLQSLVTTTTTNILHNFHSSIVSTTDRCVRFFHLFAPHNPFISKIHRRNYMKLNSLPGHNFAAILPGDSVAGIVVANGILNFLNVYNTLLVCRLVLTWFPNSPPAIVSPLSTLCDPYLNIFRGLIPPLGGTLDLSPILAFLVLNAFTSTASALPAELPSAGVSQGISSSRTELSNLTTSQKKWMRRLAANRSKSSSKDN